MAEYTKFGWTILSPSTELDLSNMFIAQTNAIDYKQLCKLDVLGLKDNSDNSSGNQETVHEEQLTRVQKAIRDEPAMEKESSSLTEQSKRKFKMFPNLVWKLEK